MFCVSALISTAMNPVIQRLLSNINELGRELENSTRNTAGNVSTVIPNNEATVNDEVQRCFRVNNAESGRSPTASVQSVSTTTA